MKKVLKYRKSKIAHKFIAGKFLWNLSLNEDRERYKWKNKLAIDAIKFKFSCNKNQGNGRRILSQYSPFSIIFKTFKK